MLRWVPASSDQKGKGSKDGYYEYPATTYAGYSKPRYNNGKGNAHGKNYGYYSSHSDKGKSSVKGGYGYYDYGFETGSNGHNKLKGEYYGPGKQSSGKNSHGYHIRDKSISSIGHESPSDWYNWGHNGYDPYYPPSYSDTRASGKASASQSSTSFDRHYYGKNRASIEHLEDAQHKTREGVFFLHLCKFRIKCT